MSATAIWQTNIYFKYPTLQVQIVSTYPRAQYVEDECGLSVAREIHHQHNTLLNIIHF